MLAQTARRLLIDRLDARLRETAVRNSWVGLSTERQRAREWAEAWAALDPDVAAVGGPWPHAREARHQSLPRLAVHPGARHLA